jgi:hypothetical protein
MALVGRDKRDVVRWASLAAALFLGQALTRHGVVALLRPLVLLGAMVVALLTAALWTFVLWVNRPAAPRGWRDMPPPAA